MKEVLPEAYAKFVENVDKLEHYFKDMQDVEFTVEKGKLWMLQCRNGKRTGVAAIRIATELVKEGICTESEALLKVEPRHVEQLLHPTFPPEALKSEEYTKGVVAKGLPGSPGAAVGKIVFTPATAEEMKAKGESVILVRETTSPEDVGGMWAASGILTARGGMTSHAAVVARGWGKPCVCGCSDLIVSESNKTVTIKDTNMVFKEGDVISINGTTGEVINTAIEVKTPTLKGDLEVLLGWADQEQGVMKVLANADSGPDALQAAGNGAMGIGLCRTEHMFFCPERLPIVRRWIFHTECLDDLDHIKHFQRSDFKDLFIAMNGMPVTIRLLDPPLHEFLPRPEQVHEKVAEELGFGKDVKRMLARIESMHEENPMLGLRGCRLGIIKPDFTKMQVEAIMSAAADFMEESPETAKPRPRIMIPLIGSINEYKNQAIIIKREAERIRNERGMDIPYEIGTMIEVPRAALVSNKIAALKDDEDGKPLCSFFSYGTNDLTQMTMGISRDDSNGFIPKYLDLGIFEDDPFQTVDEEGVGYLMKLSATLGKNANPHLSLSVCGEHGGDPKSIAFFDTVGLNYVSCSPYRVPVARLAAGQARVKKRMAEAKGAEAKDADTKVAAVAIRRDSLRCQEPVATNIVGGPALSA
jgi:pyruvate,orthophosphate dikinase